MELGGGLDSEESESTVMFRALSPTPDDPADQLEGGSDAA